MNRPLVVIVGPTASGKSDLGMKVAQRFNGEIICADSRTVYKEMDIGTAKPSHKDQQTVRHHLLDIVKPGDWFTAAEFKRLAINAIDDINARGKLPIIVGGTGLYVDSILFDYQFGPPVAPEYRAELTAKSTEELQEICIKKDIPPPENSRNKRHLIRAIELGGLLGHKKSIRTNTIVVGIATEKEVLKQRIESRAFKMIREGILEEVKYLSQRYDWDSEAMTGNIYRCFRGVIEGKKKLSEALEEFVRSDLQLAKRQMTWFKRNPSIIWSDNPNELLNKIEQFIES